MTVWYWLGAVFLAGLVLGLYELVLMLKRASRLHKVQKDHAPKD